MQLLDRLLLISKTTFPPLHTLPRLAKHSQRRVRACQIFLYPAISKQHALHCQPHWHEDLCPPFGPSHVLHAHGRLALSQAISRSFRLSIARLPASDYFTMGSSVSHEEPSLTYKENGRTWKSCGKQAVRGRSNGEPAMADV